MADDLKLSPAMEDYLKTILELSEQAEAVRVTDIASSLNIAKPSVAQALGVLREQGLITQDRYGPVRLTKKGRVYAADVQCRRQAILNFLIDVLRVNPVTATRDACQMEHTISPETLDRLVLFLNSRQYVPVDDVKISQADKGNGGFCTINDLSVGGAAEAVKITSSPLRRRLMQMGIIPGTKIVVKSVAPLGDPVEVIVKGYHLSLRRTEAACVVVRPLK